MAQKTGIVKWFSARRGYGFITDEKGNDITPLKLKQEKLKN